MRPEILHLCDTIQRLENARDGIARARDVTGNVELACLLESLIADLDHAEWHVRDIVGALGETDREEAHD